VDLSQALAGTVSEPPPSLPGQMLPVNHSNKVLQAQALLLHPPTNFQNVRLTFNNAGSALPPLHVWFLLALAGRQVQQAWQL